MPTYNDEQRRILEEGWAMTIDLPDDPEKIREIERGLEKNPDDPILWAALGCEHFTTDFQKAVDCFSESLFLDPFSANQHFNRGRKYLSLYQFRQALADLEMAVRLEPAFFARWYYRGIALFILGRYEQAVESFRRDIELELKAGGEYVPAPVDWIWLGCKKLGRDEEADEILNLVDLDTPMEEKNACYKRRVLLHKGLMTPEEYLEGLHEDDIQSMSEYFGLACHYLYTLRDREKALQYFHVVRDYTTMHNAFAYIIAGQEIDALESV